MIYQSTAYRLFFLIFLSFLVFFSQITFAQSDKVLKEPGNGKDKKTLNTKEQNTSSNKYVSRITTKVPTREVSRNSPSMKGRKNFRPSKYGGSTSLKSVRKRKKDIVKNNKKMSSYRVKMAYTSRRKKQQNANKLASYRGPVRIQQKVPRGAKKSWKTSKPRKPVSYDHKKLKKGTRGVKKSDLPNYQKYKAKKLKYNKKESDWMRTGDGMKREKVREKYLKQRGKITY